MCIEPRTPRLTGKVERLHQTDVFELYPWLTYTDDVDLRQKLEGRERFQDLAWPHAAHGGETPYEVLRELPS